MSAILKCCPDYLLPVDGASELSSECFGEKAPWNNDKISRRTSVV